MLGDFANLSMAERIALLPEHKRREVLADMSQDDLEALEGSWPFWARPSQLPPEGDWLGWLISTGRGWGKTRTAAEFICDEVEAGRSAHSGLVGRTSSDVRDVMIEGESGLVEVSRRRGFPCEWEPSRRKVTWPNQAITHTYSAEEPSLLRGPQHDLLWGDEIASWKYRESWDNAMLGLRVGHRPRYIATTTPKVNPLMRSLFMRAIPRAAYEQSPTTGAIVLTGGSTYENIANLAEVYVNEIVKGMEGSRLAQQELYGKMLEDSKDALWGRVLLEDTRVIKNPMLREIVVAIDPAASVSEDSSETAIMVCGVGEDHHGYLLEDRTLKGKPEAWAKEAVTAFNKWQANRIIAEANNGGDMVISTIHSVDRLVPCKKIIASRGKYTRAEPVATLYAQRMIHHVGYYAELEDQMCLWVPGEQSPDRLDACVWGFTDLMADMKKLIYGRDFGIA